MAAVAAREVHDVLMRSQKHKNLFTGDCRGCGQCCSRFLPLSVTDELVLQSYVARNGIKMERERAEVDLLCPFLTDGGECAVYEARPAVCRAYRCDRHAAGDYSDMGGEIDRTQSYAVVDMRERFRWLGRS